MNQNFFEPNPCYEPNFFSFDQYQPSQSSITQQLPQRSNEGIKLEMAKLIKNNRILFNDNVFPHEEASMEVLLAKERILKLIQAWDEKQIESWSLPALLHQLLNDSRTINEMLKQREQAANSVVQQEQEEQADDEEMLQDREKFMQDTQTFLKKFNRISFGVTPRVLSIAWERISKIKYVFTEPEEIPELMCKLLEDVRNIKEELAGYINTPSWNSPTLFYEDDEEYYIQYKEYLEKFPDAVTTVLPTEEPEYSLSMGYEHLSTTPETKLDEVTESSAKNLLPIPSEYEDTSDDESECDVPVKDESSLAFTTFSNHLFDVNDDFTSSDDESLSEEDVPIEEFKVYSSPLFDVEEINSDEIDPYCFNAESDLIESLLNRYNLIDSSPKFDFLLKEFSGELAHINPILPGIKKADFDLEEEIRLIENLLIATLMDEIELFLATDDLLPLSIESDNYDSEGDIHFLEKLLVDDSIPLPENESLNFDHHDDPLFPRPPLEPPDVEFFFDLEPDLISAVKNIIDELNEDECFDPGGEIDVFANDEDDDYFPFIFVIRIFLPYLIYPEVFPLLLSAGSEDTIFDPGIFV
uniref:Reverse transcriptase domain-containing protein n=1 Tax=Tanacetum cinerariifolium TaxID=118510 RepID=A0A6L2M0I8_TANCI|nr:hypothetical protein [Tanacetum cinerariifolium]